MDPKRFGESSIISSESERGIEPDPKTIGPMVNSKSNFERAREAMVEQL